MKCDVLRKLDRIMSYRFGQEFIIHLLKSGEENFSTHFKLFAQKWDYGNVQTFGAKLLWGSGPQKF